MLVYLIYRRPPLREGADLTPPPLLLDGAERMLPPLLLEGAERKLLGEEDRLGLTLLEGDTPLEGETLLLGVIREGAVLAGGL